MLFVDYKLDQVTFKRFEKFLSLPDDANLGKTDSLSADKGEVEFENVDFAYDEKQILKNLSLKFEGGKSTALVGTTGGGKSTIVKLVLSLLKPDSGNVKIDEQNISDVNLESYYDHIAYISQDAPIFDGTIRENLIFDRQVSEKEIFDVLEKVKLKKLVEGLPQKLDTEIGERGIKLSGGQKQRLAIARMVLSNPKIIIFDEATSQLDSESEKKIQDALWKVAKQRTTIIIAHRLSTVTRADKIVVLKDGKIKEVGTHQELVDMGELYARFWQLQTLSQ